MCAWARILKGICTWSYVEGVSQHLCFLLCGDVLIEKIYRASLVVHLAVLDAPQLRMLRQEDPKSKATLSQVIATTKGWCFSGRAQGHRVRPQRNNY